MLFQCVDTYDRRFSLPWLHNFDAVIPSLRRVSSEILLRHTEAKQKNYYIKKTPALKN